VELNVQTKKEVRNENGINIEGDYC